MAEAKIIKSFSYFFILSCLQFITACDGNTTLNPVVTPPINRQQVVERHNPGLRDISYESPFTLGNGKFAFTADVTGLQSFPDLYFQHGIPLETKARWAWHSRPNSQQFQLEDTFESYEAYERVVQFPTTMDSAAGQWLRQNPHDLPLARIGFVLDDKPLDTAQLKNIRQILNLWSGALNSQYTLEGEAVAVDTLVDSETDTLAVNINSPLLQQSRLAAVLRFPRGYDLTVKNTPDILWAPDHEHLTEDIHRDSNSAMFRRALDDAEHYVLIRWVGEARLVKRGEHEYRLVTHGDSDDFSFSVTFSQTPVSPAAMSDFLQMAERSAKNWRTFWHTGAAIDFSGSTNPKAHELERRIILSRYLLAVQARSAIPAQETGLTSSSWYGKHHTEMTWWHTAHWALWGQPQELQKVLDWYSQHLNSARALARQRGLSGARWAKMVGPDNRESPGGNPLIIWNQPQLIHLAELLYRRTSDHAVLWRYADLVEETAQAMADMLTWDEARKVYSLKAPIWIAQEIYDPRHSHNPTFELAYWREGLRIASLWRSRLEKTAVPEWEQMIVNLAPLPQRDGKYVAIESIPDTFQNSESRQDHPSMLAAYGLLNDPEVDTKVMQATLDAVLTSWNWKSKIWGWDYPMIAMTAARLERPQTAVDALLLDSVNNQYLPNGHCPQQGAELPVYLPANGALLAAVAMMVAGWDGAPARNFPGFPNDRTWQIKAEGFMLFP